MPAKGAMPNQALEVVQLLHHHEPWSRCIAVQAGRLAVYDPDHGLPHFHIDGPDFRCSVAIVSFEVIVGTVPTAVLSKALDWARPNRTLLMQTWQELNG